MYRREIIAPEGEHDHFELADRLRIGLYSASRRAVALKNSPVSGYHQYAHIPWTALERTLLRASIYIFTSNLLKKGLVLPQNIIPRILERYCSKCFCKNSIFRVVCEHLQFSYDILDRIWVDGLR